MMTTLFTGCTVALFACDQSPAASKPGGTVLWVAG
jgi:hypothetical protein